MRYFLNIKLDDNKSKYRFDKFLDIGIEIKNKINIGTLLFFILIILCCVFLNFLYQYFNTPLLIFYSVIFSTMVGVLLFINYMKYKINLKLEEIKHELYLLDETPEERLNRERKEKLTNILEDDKLCIQQRLKNIWKLGLQVLKRFL